MSEQYTFIWWGDGYMVYDGDEYIGKDDQVDLVELMEAAGVARKVDAEAQQELLDDYWGAPLSELLTLLGEDQ